MYSLIPLGYFSSILCLLISIYNFPLCCSENSDSSLETVINEVGFVIVLLRISGIASSDRQSFLFNALIYMTER